MKGNQEKDPAIRTGTPKVKATALPHVCGVRSGNSTGHYDWQPCHLPDTGSTAQRSTGINAEARNPLLPDMPNLSLA